MQIPRRKPLTANVAVVSVGFKTYWNQFDGLLDEMHRKGKLFCSKVAACGVNVNNFGLVDDPQSAQEVLPRLLASDPDILFVHMATYSTSIPFAILLREVRCPVVLAALQPMAAMDYARGTTFMQLCNDDICSVPEFTGVAIRMNRAVSDVIIGMEENDPAADAAIAEWCSIAKVRHDLRRARIGLMGRVLDTMLDMQTDPAAVTAAFGAHAVPCEPDSILRDFMALDEKDAQVVDMSRRILEFFDTPDPVSDPITTKLTHEDLMVASRAGVALEQFIAEKRLDGLAYYYESMPDTPMRQLVTNFIVGNSLLTGAGFPMCGEFDIKTCIAMLIFDRLDIGGSFAEFHPVDFTRDTVLVGHDGPHHINIADRRPVIRSLKKYHGKPGSGASVEFNIKTGPISMLSIGVNENGKFKFVIAEGESLPGPIPPTGNTNTHGKFQPDVRTFLKRWCMAGPTHHFALGVGHHAETIKKVADCFNIESEIIR